MNPTQSTIATMTAAADLVSAIVMRSVGFSITGSKDGQYITQAIVAKVACTAVRDELYKGPSK